MKLSQRQWFIVLWLGGFLSLLIIAGIFRLILKLAYR
ncbi:MAG: DUF2474 domain-containing protein [Acinetobacter populi]|jgi:hypothetical protein|nr:DUF2474 domain-containing protein [Acinetobacter populi]MCH4248534.1 DUF2474 domain-containing protein [Acinetobacter populi]